MQKPKVCWQLAIVLVITLAAQAGCDVFDESLLPVLNADAGRGCGSANDCPPIDNQCMQVDCVEATCVVSPRPRGTACSSLEDMECDGLGGCQSTSCGDGFANGNETCDPTDPATPCCRPDCSGALPSDAACGEDPSNGCIAAPRCDGAGFLSVHCIQTLEPDGTSCNDGQFCNGADICSSGSCVHAGTPCVNDPGNCADRCDEETDSCTGHEATGTACARSCFTGSQCNSSGICAGGIPSC